MFHTIESALNAVDTSIALQTHPTFDSTFKAIVVALTTEVREAIKNGEDPSEVLLRANSDTYHDLDFSLELLGADPEVKKMVLLHCLSF